MAKISSYPIISTPTLNDLLIGTDVDNLNNTKNFTIGEIGDLIGQDYVPYVGATGNVNLGAFNIRATAFIVDGGTASQFLKANGTLDSTAYVPETRTLTINGTTYNLAANRSWDISTIDSLTTVGTGGAATYINKVLNIPIYQSQGNYITQLSGEATGSGPGNASVTLSNSAVISKVLTGLNITGGTVVASDTILQAFGKVQNQINGLTGGVEYQGTWNAATNTPFLQSSVGVKGHYYVVNVAGNTDLNGITDWKVGDWAIYNGTAWDKVDNTDAVSSVNGYTGAVVLTASDVGAVPTARTLTINGVAYDLSANRSWTVGDVRTDQSYINPSWITSLGWSKITSTPTTLAGYGITDGASNTTTLTINGVTFDISANRTWNVGTVTSVGTSGPITGGTITGSGTIGITQAGPTSDGYLSAADWNTFNNKQVTVSVNAPLTFSSGVIGITQSGASSDGYLSSSDWNTFNSKVSGSGTANTLPMWGSSSSLTNSPLSYALDTFNFQYNSATGGTVNFTNIGLTTYTYSILMNNFGAPRSTVHSYTDGLIIQSIGGTQVSRMFANGNLILGTGTVDNGRRLEINGTFSLTASATASVATQIPVFTSNPSGPTPRQLVTRTPAQLLSDIGAQGALTLTTIGTSGPATLISNTLNIPDYGSVLTGYVPYTGATQNVNLGEWGITAGYFQADLTPTQAAAIGRLIWNNTDGTLNLRLLGGNVDLHIGQQQYARIVNGTGGNVLRANYQAVKIIGAQGQRMQVGLARADNDFNSKDTLGLIAENINNNNEGFVISSGLIEEINTTGSLQGETWNDGDTLYLSGTTFGSLTNIKPIAPIHTVIIGFVVYAHANQGKIFVKVDNGYELEELHDVNPLPYVNNGVLYRDTTVNLWKSATIPTLLGYTPANAATTLTINGTTFDLSANRTWSVGTVTSVAALTLGTSGTDLSSTVSNGTTTPVITLNVPTASATNRGALSSADWTTFNNKLDLTSLLTGYTVGPNTPIAATDSLLTAFGELQGQINARVSGTLATGQVAFGTAANTVGGSSTFTFSPTAQLLLNNSVTASSAIARGASITSTLVAAANDDLLVGLNINPTFTNGAFTGVRNVGLRVQSGRVIIGSSTLAHGNLFVVGGEVVLGGTTALIRPDNFGNGTGGGIQLSASNTPADQYVAFGQTLSATGVFTERWRIFSTGVLQSNGAQTIQTSTGNLTLATAGGNGNIILSPNGTGSVQVVSNVISLNADNASPNVRLGRFNFVRSIYDPNGVAASIDFWREGAGSEGLLAFSTNPGTSGDNSVERLRITSTGNVLINTTANAGFRLDVNGTTRLNGLQTFQGTTASDTAPLGSELATTGSGTNWTGTDFATGYTHVVGSTASLTTSLAAVVSTFYQITYTVTGRTAGSFTINYGGTSTTGLTATGAVGPLATSTATLEIVPTTDFNGTIVLSVRTIGTSSAITTFRNSAGITVNSIRYNGSSNIGIGASSLQRLTTGVQNNSFGQNALLNTTTGSNNNAFGENAMQLNSTGNANNAFGRVALLNNTTGSNNSAFGHSAMSNSTTGIENSAFGSGALISNAAGNSNSGFGSQSLNANSGSSNNAFGRQALFANTTGSNNIGIGNAAGRFITGGVANTITNNSIFIGNDTRANAVNETNQIVIGHTAIGLGSNTTVIGNSSTTFGRWFGSLLLGTSTNVASSIFTMSSTTQGFLPPRMTAAQRTAIASPAEGLIVFQTDSVIGLYIYANATWRSLTMV